ncbi:MAG: hypothetical protein GX591_03270 [Planctomycetes bacterium]|nr:hypothetical protein [Planctomycetota bacterium]
MADATTTALLPEVRQTARELRRMATGALARMYRPAEAMFAFRCRRTPHGPVLEGTSRRYTCTALVALAHEAPEVRRQVLGGHSVDELCERMVKASGAAEDLGEVAMALWAARALHHAHASIALNRLQAMVASPRPWPTVELAWGLSALAAEDDATDDPALAERLARRLLDAYRPDSGLFAHGSAGGRADVLRAHIGDFADFVYPVCALATWVRRGGDDDALAAARHSAERMCELQGEQGQWWWHFDVRNGSVIERFPVYAVHQDAMAPMALFALADACGDRHDEAIARGVRWLVDPPETSEPLIDAAEGIIWRKVARREPVKLARGLQAAASRLHPRLRAPGLDVLLPPGVIDYESRPYHMAWILYAWTPQRIAQFGGDEAPEGVE